MKTIAGCFAIAAAAAGMPLIAVAQTATTDAYATSPAAGGAIWKNPFGLCWRTTEWTREKAIAECDPDLVSRPAPRAAPAAPVPVPAPVAAPTPAPVLDSDGDGVPDSQDRCPNTPAGAKVDARGCEIDSDGDGVVDRLDKCPGTRPGVKVDANGCEIPDVVVLKGVTFATGSAQLTGNSTAILDEAAATLLKRGDVKTEVAGYTDNRGAPAGNRALSQRRSEAVMRYLVSKGVSAGNLSARGYGQENPVADNATEAGRAANRRVELRALR